MRFQRFLTAQRIFLDWFGSSKRFLRHSWLHFLDLFDFLLLVFLHHFDKNWLRSYNRSFLSELLSPLPPFLILFFSLLHQFLIPLLLLYSPLFFCFLRFFFCFGPFSSFFALLFLDSNFFCLLALPLELLPLLLFFLFQELLSSISIVSSHSLGLGRRGWGLLGFLWIFFLLRISGLWIFFLFRYSLLFRLTTFWYLHNNLQLRCCQWRRRLCSLERFNCLGLLLGILDGSFLRCLHCF